jgi:hypothetical protein
MYLIIGGRKLIGQILLPPSVDLKVSVDGYRGAGILMPAAKFLPVLTASPIPAGGLAEGWIYAMFNQKDIDEYYSQKGSVEVEFTDAVSSASHSVKSTNIPERGTYLPGMPRDKIKQ